jgi:exocyst complex component 2
MLLTLSNLQLLRATVVPSLNTQFENAFSVKLTDETKTIRDVLGQIDARLFQSYTSASVETLRSIIRQGVTSPDWVSSSSPPGTKAREVKPYVYEALLNLVLVHSQVATTASSLTSQVLSYLLEQASRELLDAFRTRPKYPVPEPVYHRPRLGAAEPDLPGARQPHRQRRPRQVAGRAARDAGRAQAP